MLTSEAMIVLILCTVTVSFSNYVDFDADTSPNDVNILNNDFLPESDK